MLELFDKRWAYIRTRHAHNILAMVGTLGCLNQLLPERFISRGTVWTDIFSDSRFLQTAQVEAT